MTATFLLRLPADGHPAGAVRVALKDLVDLRGTPTTSGSPAVAVRCTPAERDAACLSGIRAAESRGEAVIVGKTNLHELAFGGDGINPHYGTPVKPARSRTRARWIEQRLRGRGRDGRGRRRTRLRHGRLHPHPVAVLRHRGPEDDVGPCAARRRRASLAVLDTVGPMARDVAGIVTGMDLVEPGFRASVVAASGRLRRRVAVLRAPGDQAADLGLDAAVDAALAGAGIEVVRRGAPWWGDAIAESLVVLLGEAWRVLRPLLEREHLLDPRIATRIRLGSSVDDARLSRPARRGHRSSIACASCSTASTPSRSRRCPCSLRSSAAPARTTRRTRLHASGQHRRHPGAVGARSAGAGHLRARHAHLRGSVQLMAGPGDEATLCALGGLLSR